MMNEKNQWVFGIDVGGTFTDLVAVNKDGKNGFDEDAFNPRPV